MSMLSGIEQHHISFVGRNNSVNLVKRPLEKGFSMAISCQPHSQARRNPSKCCIKWLPDFGSHSDIHLICFLGEASSVTCANVTLTTLSIN